MLFIESRAVSLFVRLMCQADWNPLRDKLSTPQLHRWLLRFLYNTLNIKAFSGVPIPDTGPYHLLRTRPSHIYFPVGKFLSFFIDPVCKFSVSLFSEVASHILRSSFQCLKCGK